MPREDYAAFKRNVVAKTVLRAHAKRILAQSPDSASTPLTIINQVCNGARTYEPGLGVSKKGHATIQSLSDSELRVLAEAVIKEFI